MSDPLRGLPRLSIAILASLLLLSGCGGGGKSGTPRSRDLLVTYFSHDDRNDVYRNQTLEIRFSSPVRESSVSGRTIRLLTGPNQQTPYEAGLVVDGNRILIDPTYSEAAFDRTGFGAPPDRPFGLDAEADYQVFLPAPPTLKTLTNRSGKGIVRSFFASFRTSELYMPELTAPQFIGIDGTGTLGFMPEKRFDDSLGRFVTPHDAEILLQFSEPLDPASMDPGVTVLIRNESVVDFQGNPLEIPGTFRPGTDGTLWYFAPSFHYGTGPYRISVTLTQGIRDLAGNPLANPKTLFFDTEHVPELDTIAVITEDFENNVFEDPLLTDAEWNTVEEGELRGGAITTTVVTVQYAPQPPNAQKTRVEYPLTAVNSGPGCLFAWPNGNRTQCAYRQVDLGGPGAITEIAWGPNSNALFAATHGNLQIRLGHTKTPEGILGTTFADNFRDGVPLPHYDGRYNIPQRANINPPGLDDGFWPYPKLTSPFDYDGQDGLVIDWQVTSANDCQTLRAWFWGVAATSPGVKNVVATSRSATTDNFTGGGQPLVFDMQFTKRRRLTNAQSTWYDTAQSTPDYADPILSPPQQAGGAAFVLEFQGADGMPDPIVPTKVIPDPSTETPWGTNADVADGKRFLRFRLLLIANLNSDTVTRFAKVQVPYSFKP